MDPQDDRLEPILRRLGLTYCPTCQTPITTANVLVGWNTRAEFDTPYGPTVWMVCTRCGAHLKDAYPPDFVQSQEEAITILSNALTDAS